MNGKWQSRNERTVYESKFLTLTLSDVTLSDGRETELEIVRCGKAGAGAVVYDAEKGVLLIWRHRTTTDLWGWEIPGGRVDDDERPEDAAARETLEETGWRPGKLSPLPVPIQLMNGIVDHPCHFFFADGATWEGPSPDANEAADISWIPVSQIKEIMRNGEMNAGFSLVPLLWALVFGPLANSDG